MQRIRCNIPDMILFWYFIVLIWFSIEYIDNERLKDKSFDEFYDGELYFDIASVQLLYHAPIGGGGQARA